MEHASDWYEIAKEHYGESISNGSLYLITGFYKARSWSLASFHDATDRERRQILVVPREGEGTTAWRDWRSTFPLNYRNGPSHNGNVNQTVFISGLKIAVRDDVFGWLSQKPEIQPVPAVQPRGNGLLGILPYLFRVSIYGFTILSDKLHAVFSLFLFPLGIYSNKSRIKKIKKLVENGVGGGLEGGTYPTLFSGVSGVSGVSSVSSVSSVSGVSFFSVVSRICVVCHVYFLFRRAKTMWLASRKPLPVN